MSHPGVRTIKFMLAERWTSAEPHTLATINAALRRWRLFPVDQETYDEILLDFAPPPDFAFDDHTHEPTRMFMKAEKLMTMWEPGRSPLPQVQAKLLPLWHVRRRLDILLMGNLYSEEVAPWVRRWVRATPGSRIVDDVSPEWIDLYRHYYMDPWACDVVAWQRLLRGHAYEEAMLSSLHGGADIATYWAGVPVTTKDRSAPIKSALHVAHVRILALQHQPTSKAVVDQTAKLADVIDRLTLRLYGSPAEGFLEEAEKVKERIFELRHSKEKIPSIDEVVGPEGSYMLGGQERRSARAPAKDSTPASEKATDDRQVLRPPRVRRRTRPEEVES